MNQTLLLVGLLTLPLGCFASATSARAQTVPGKLLAFDVVSIKPGKPGCASVGIGAFSPGDFQAICFPLKGIIAYAYGYDVMRDERILGGPGWIDSENFDLEAKVDAADMDAYGKLSRSEIRRMLQAVLGERFGMMAHHESRDLPVYALVIAKGGPKIKEAKPGDPSNEPEGMPKIPSGIVRRKGTLIAWNSKLSGLLPFIQGELGRTMVDETGLMGNYTFTLKWTPETMAAGGANGGGAQEDTGPSIFTALQEQLGLMLVSKKEPQDVLVIDQVQHPSPN